eukprot:4989550-Prymnesium_polylepis.1
MDVPLSQISQWESDFLEIIEYNADVQLAQYATLCFELQARYETLARPLSTHERRRALLHLPHAPADTSTRTAR